MKGQYVNDELGRKWPWLNVWYYPSICLEGLKKTTKISVRIASLQAMI
jgi:hypothetical protein